MTSSLVCFLGLIMGKTFSFTLPSLLTMQRTKNRNICALAPTHQRCHSNDFIIKLASSPSKSNLNEDGKCKFGEKSYWDQMYNGTGDRPSEAYSWYCGYDELAPFWNMLVQPLSETKQDSKVLVAGIGNDPAPIDLYDDGWNNMIAFDYSESGVNRARELFGPRKGVKLLTADCRDLPLSNGLVDATLDKGTLDAIYITGKNVFRDSVKELTRVTAENGVIVCISAVIPQDEMMDAFASSGMWENIHDGDLAFAPDGEATIDLGAQLYSWRKRSCGAQ